MSTYQIDTAHSSAQFKVRHMMIANVKGEFDKVSGNVTFDPANPEASSVEATIDVASISTRDEQRDGCLRPLAGFERVVDDAPRPAGSQSVVQADDLVSGRFAPR